MKKKLLLILLITLIALPIFASADEQYEYMVVSFGKAQFSSMRSKTMAYWDEGISKETLSAQSYEKNLDILGANGWQVISITGVIGGDQQVILKRNLDIKRSEAELKTIDENSKKIIDGSIDVLFDTQKSDTKILIELDNLEKQQIIDKPKKDFEKNFKNYTSFLNKKPTNIFYDWEYYSKKVKIIIDFDVTSDCLIDENYYRKSLVEKQLESYIEPIKNKIKDKSLLGDITCNGYIKYLGGKYLCGTIKISPSIYGDYWDNF